jgi:hypothetical protein
MESRQASDLSLRKAPIETTSPAIAPRGKSGKATALDQDKPLTSIATRPPSGPPSAERPSHVAECFLFAYRLSGVNGMIGGGIASQAEIDSHLTATASG